MLHESGLECILRETDVCSFVPVYAGEIRSVHKLIREAIIVQRAITASPTVTILLWVCIVGVGARCTISVGLQRHTHNNKASYATRLTIDLMTDLGWLDLLFTYWRFSLGLW